MWEELGQLPLGQRGRTYELLGEGGRLGWCVTHSGQDEGPRRQWRCGQHWFFFARQWPAAFTLKLYQANGVPPGPIFDEDADLSARYACSPLRRDDAAAGLAPRYAILGGPAVRGYLAFGPRRMRWAIDPVQTTLVGDDRFLSIPPLGLTFESCPPGAEIEIPPGWFWADEPSLP